MENGAEGPILRISEEQGIEFATLQQVMLRSTVPIMAEIVENRPIPQGTGTLFRINDRHFIITARHVFKTDPDLLSHLAVPDDLETGRFTRVLNLQYTVPKQEFVDV